MSDLYRLICEKPGHHYKDGKTIWHNQRCYFEVKPTDRICDEHDASVDINDKPYCTQGIILEETAMCVLSDVVRIPKEDKT